MAPTSPQHFHFGGGPGPYASAPSSPRPFGNPEEYYCYTSAPTSPARAAAVYSYLARGTDDWEEKPIMMTPKFGNEFGFSLGVGGQQELSTADELFDKGQIRPLKPQRSELPPKSPKQSRGRWSPSRGQRGKEEEKMTAKEAVKERGRGREMLPPATASSRSRREYSRSLSPLRGGEGVKTPGSSPSTSTTVKSSSGSRKWRLKDLLLFRSASEGRATGRGNKDPLRKYTLLSSSFNKRRPAGGGEDQDSIKSSSGCFNKRGVGVGSSAGPSVSAHELHYTANRAASEEMKKKTPLPFHRNSLFGCLHFNPAVRSITRGFNTYSFNRQ